MAVTKKASAPWLFLAVFSTACSAGKAENDFEVEALARAEREFLDATTEFGETIELCSQKADKESVPIIDAEKLSQLGAERGDILVGLAYLSAENMFRCERDARLAMAYRAGALSYLRKELGKASDEVEKVERGFIYPSIQYYKYQIEYEKLPQNLKLYLEEAAGSEPFDVIKAIDVNNLGVD